MAVNKVTVGDKIAYKAKLIGLGACKVLEKCSIGRFKRCFAIKREKREKDLEIRKNYLAVDKYIQGMLKNISNSLNEIWQMHPQTPEEEKLRDEQLKELENTRKTLEEDLEKNQKEFEEKMGLSVENYMKAVEKTKQLEKRPTITGYRNLDDFLSAREMDKMKAQAHAPSQETSSNTPSQETPANTQQRGVPTPGSTHDYSQPGSSYSPRPKANQPAPDPGPVPNPTPTPADQTKTPRQNKPAKSDEQKAADRAYIDTHKKLSRAETAWDSYTKSAEGIKAKEAQKKIEGKQRADTFIRESKSREERASKEYDKIGEFFLRVEDDGTDLLKTYQKFFYDRMELERLEAASSKDDTRIKELKSAINESKEKLIKKGILQVEDPEAELKKLDGNETKRYDIKDGEHVVSEDTFAKQRIVEEYNKVITDFQNEYGAMPGVEPISSIPLEFKELEYTMRSGEHVIEEQYIRLKAEYDGLHEGNAKLEEEWGKVTIEQADLDAAKQYEEKEAELAKLRAEDMAAEQGVDKADVAELMQTALKELDAEDRANQAKQNQGQPKRKNQDKQNQGQAQLNGNGQQGQQNQGQQTKSTPSSLTPQQQEFIDLSTILTDEQYKYVIDLIKHLVADPTKNNDQDKTHQNDSI